MRVAVLCGVLIAVAVLLTLLSKCLGIAWGFGIMGAVVVLVGTFVLIGDHWKWFRRTFNRMSRRFCAIESGLNQLRGDPSTPRDLKNGQPGFKKILEIVAERTRIEPSGISAIRYGCVGGEGSVVREHVMLCRGTIDSPPPCDTIGTKEVVERWINDARLRSLSLLGFTIVFIGVVLGLVSLIMQAIASGNC